VFGVVEQLQAEETAATSTNDYNAERGRFRQRHQERQLQIAGGNKQSRQNWKTKQCKFFLIYNGAQSYETFRRLALPS
jgi:hypothetical protein